MVGGSLDDIGLGNLIQAYCASRQTSRITLTYPDAEGHLFFEAGELVHADLGSLSGSAAVHGALQKRGGQFHVDLGMKPPVRTITQHWSSLVIEGMKRGNTDPGVRARPAVAAGGASRPVAAVPAPRPSAPTPLPAPAPVVAVPSAAPPEPARFPQKGAPMPDSTGGEPRSPLRPTAAAPSRPPRPLVPEPAAPPPSRLPLLLGIGGVVLLLVVAAVWYFSKPSPAAATAPVPRANAAAAGGRVVTLGMSAALTGPAKELGRQMKLGVETALDAANDSGGIHGHRFQLVALDDGYEPERTRGAMKELVEQRKVFAIVGNVGTPTAEVAVPYALEKKVPFFGAFTGAGLLRREPPDRYVLNYRASYVEETAAVVKYLVEIRKVKPTHIAVFAQQDGFGDAGFAGVTKALRRYGRNQDQILRVGFKRNTLEIADAVAEVVKNKNNIQAIVMVAPYRPAARFIEKVKDAGLDPIFTNVSFVGSTALAEELRQLGPKYSAGVIVTQVVPPIDSSATAVIHYREQLDRYFHGEKPDYVSLEGYIAANVLLEGFRRAGDNPTPEGLVDAIEGIRGLDLGIGTPISYGLSEHQGSHKVWGTVLDQNANFQVFDME
jgi:branched-chain amino acid transport system substrate-binding protein